MIEELWNEYCKQANLTAVECGTAFQFGAEADKLLSLVIDNKKTATSSLYDLYNVYDTPLPKPNTYHIVLDRNSYPRAIIKITDVSIIEFNSITEGHAKLEGEGSLEEWKTDHTKFFNKQVENTNIQFTNKSKIVFEQFECVYYKQ